MDMRVLQSDSIPEGSASIRSRDKKYVSKACLACRNAKTKCDSREPRCSHCELRDFVCDYSWQQKQRGPPPNPNSGRSERRRRRIERNILPNSLYPRPNGVPRVSPESDASTKSSNSRSSPPHVPPPASENARSNIALPDSFMAHPLILGDARVCAVDSHPKVTYHDFDVPHLSTPSYVVPDYTTVPEQLPHYSTTIPVLETPIWRSDQRLESGLGTGIAADVLRQLSLPQNAASAAVAHPDYGSLVTISLPRGNITHVAAAGYHSETNEERDLLGRSASELSAYQLSTPQSTIPFLGGMRGQAFGNFYSHGTGTISPPSVNGLTLSNPNVPYLASTLVPVSSIRPIPSSVPRALTIFDDLPPLPSSEIMNEILHSTFENVMVGHNLFAFLTIHRPSFCARIRSGSVDPLLFLCVLCLGCRQHPARDIIRPTFSKRVIRYLGWVTESAKQSGEVPISTIQALICWTYFVMADMGRLASGQSWQEFILAICRKMRFDLEVDPFSDLDWIQREERRRIWWWCWFSDSVIGVGSKRQPQLPDMHAAILLPCAESYFNLDPPPSVAPANSPSWIVQADPPLFMDRRNGPLEEVKDHVWLFLTGLAKQCRSILRVIVADEKETRKQALQTHITVSATLMNVFPAAVRRLASDDELLGGSYVYQGWFDRGRDLPTSVAYPIGAMAIAVYATWIIPMGPRTKNMLDDLSWVGSEHFLPCMELANACTKLIERLLIAVPTFPIPGTAVLFSIFQIGVLHLLCVKQALDAAPITKTSTNPSALGRGETIQRGVLLSEVLNSVGTTSWTSNPNLNAVVLDSLAKADIHGRVLKLHATETKAGEGIWSLWEAMLADAVPVFGALGAFEVTEGIVEVNPEDYQS
ncbi:hypothetical protein M427DRAFT_52923 [Gonapodya prolifera JEL478]|uniref:Zn(2)-C6 fungal-type domain-containing protein n=1 Tax=Gonapodya prolifera (strain JEL478) TaxID=1344416 RepID=A0A139ARW7_GONPJ|nr:hypothetical protein M427DRAFT_52923 [Gonapodya prolifera JEL478]|eukprot:KXS19491.1 hypothetical protein M427DRAFT_52923 [Gonapodya prolifera JEL478]